MITDLLYRYPGVSQAIRHEQICKFRIIVLWPYSIPDDNRSTTVPVPGSEPSDQTRTNFKFQISKFLTKATFHTAPRYFVQFGAHFILRRLWECNKRFVPPSKRAAMYPGLGFESGLDAQTCTQVSAAVVNPCDPGSLFFEVHKPPNNKAPKKWKKIRSGLGMYVKNTILASSPPIL